MFSGFNVPKIFCFQTPMLLRHKFSRSYILRIQPSQSPMFLVPCVPIALCSHSPMVSEPYVFNALCSQSLIVPYISKTFYSQSPMFLDLNVSRSLCSQRELLELFIGLFPNSFMFPGPYVIGVIFFSESYVPRSQYSQSLMYSDSYFLRLLYS